jgi:hypothetical protein
LSAAHAQSIGKHAGRLSSEQLDEIQAEAGPVLERLGYPTREGTG